MDEVTQQNAALVEQAAAAAASLREQAESLALLIARFKIDGQPAREASPRVQQSPVERIDRAPRTALRSPSERVSRLSTELVHAAIEATEWQPARDAADELADVPGSEEAVVGIRAEESTKPMQILPQPD